MTPSTPAVSPLRQRMLDDMRMRKLGPKTQAAYVRAVRYLAGFLQLADRIEGTHDTLLISKTFRRPCASCAGVMPSKGKNSRYSGAASVQASCICC
jgi:hypothetical protein